MFKKRKRKRKTKKKLGKDHCYEGQTNIVVAKSFKAFKILAFYLLEAHKLCINSHEQECTAESGIKWHTENY